MASAVMNSMKIVTQAAVTGKSQSKTLSRLRFAARGDGQALTDDEKGSAVKYLSQRMVALTNNVYGETDWIRTVNVDTEGVTHLG